MASQTLVIIGACSGLYCLFSAKPLSKLMLTLTEPLDTQFREIEMNELIFYQENTFENFICKLKPFVEPSMS